MWTTEYRIAGERKECLRERYILHQVCSNVRMLVKPHLPCNCSDSKREVEKKAKEMTRKVDSDDNSEAGDQMDKTGKAKAAGKGV